MSVTRNHESHYVTVLDNPHIFVCSSFTFVDASLQKIVCLSSIGDPLLEFLESSQPLSADK